MLILSIFFLNALRARNIAIIVNDRGIKTWQIDQLRLKPCRHLRFAPLSSNPKYKGNVITINTEDIYRIQTEIALNKIIFKETFMNRIICHIKRRWMADRSISRHRRYQ